MSASDQQAAAQLTIGLSGQLAQVALGVLGAQAVIAFWVIDRRVHLDVFYGVSIAGTAGLILSVIVGGRGVAEIIRDGFDGVWKIKVTHGKFNIQAILLLVGAVLVVASAFLGDPKP